MMQHDPDYFDFMTATINRVGWLPPNSTYSPVIQRSIYRMLIKFPIARLEWLIYDQVTALTTDEALSDE